MRTSIYRLLESRVTRSPRAGCTSSLTDNAKKVIPHEIILCCAFGGGGQSSRDLPQASPSTNIRTINNALAITNPVIIEDATERSEET